MSDKKELNQQRDYFSRYMQQQLKGHRLPPDESCWDEIEQRMQRRRRALFIRRGLCIAGAAVLALLLVMNIPINKDTNTYSNEVIEELANNEVKADSSIDNSVLAEASPVNPTHVITVAKAKRTATVPESEENKDDNPEEIIEHETENELELESEAEPEKELETEKDEPFIEQKKKLTELPVLAENRLSIPTGTGQKKNWQVSAGFTAMGNLPEINHDELVMDLNPGEDTGGIPTPPDYPGQYGPDDFDDITYNTPVSFGVKARKELGRKLSVETGLVYTYLSSDMTKNGTHRVKGELGLHYLGIPVNMIVSLWNDSKWDVYASAGGMVEKGLRSVFKVHTYTYSTGREEETTLKTSIPGLQWSLHGSIGISYRFVKEWSLYAEPGISYFFDNNQPLSKRTDKPFNLGIGLGVRFQF